MLTETSNRNVSRPETKKKKNKALVTAKGEHKEKSQCGVKPSKDNPMLSPPPFFFENGKESRLLEGSKL